MFPKQVLSISAFRALWLGQAISQLGDSFYYVVNAFMIKKLTGSAAMVGFNGVLECLPFLLIGPFAGVLADRLDRRRIMIASDLACFLTLLGLGLVVFLRPVPPVEAILATSALMFIARSFFLPSKNAAIPSIVPQDLLLKANAASAFTQNFVPMIGLALSAGVLGILYSISTTWFFLSAILVNSLSFLGSALFVRQLPALRAERTDRPKSAMKELRAGLGYVRHNHLLKLLVIQGALINLMVAPFFVAYVAANEAWFGGKPQTLSWLEFTFFAGMIGGSVAVGAMKSKRVGAPYMIGLAVVGLTVAAMGLVKSLPLWVVWNLLAGLGLPFAQIPVQSYVQATVPDAFRGRVQSVFSMAGIGMQPLGLALGGVMVDRIGLVASFLVMGLGMSAPLLIGALDHDFRSARLPEHEAPYDVAGDPVAAS